MEKTKGYWEGEWNISPAHSVSVIAELEETDKLPDRFHNFLNLVKTKDVEFRYAAAEKLLDLYNDTWIEGEPISEDQFVKRIKLESISFDEAEDDVSIYYDDGDLFGGHSIKVDVNFDGTVTKADLP